MPTRREFLNRTGAAVTLLALPTYSARATEVVELAPLVTPRSTGRIKAAIRREETTLRLGGDGDNFHMTWAADDRQYVAVCDGAGWTDSSEIPCNSRLFAVRGGPNGAEFEKVGSYPERSVWSVVRDPVGATYYGFGTLAIDGHIYQFLSTQSKPSADNNLRFIGAKLVYSSDSGRTWNNQDGSTPVVWESVADRSRKNMAFFEESQDAFSLTTILQMGKNYEANRDGFVYIYAPNGNSDGAMNELVMFRVPRKKIVDRNAYSYFAGIEPGGGAKWSKDINARRPVQTFPRGWVNLTAHPYAWQPSVVYNEPLNLYIMANWGMGVARNGDWFGKPSYLGFWSSPSPWGPWIQFHEETAWMPLGDSRSRAYQPQIAPKWIAPDGKSFWLVWTDFQHNEEFMPTLRDAMNASDQTEFRRILISSRQHRPYYMFNVQRVDLLMT